MHLEGPYVFGRVYKPELKALDALSASQKLIVLMGRGMFKSAQHTFILIQWLNVGDHFVKKLINRDHKKKKSKRRA